MPLQWFLAWWNLAFIVPFLLAVFYLLIYAASGLTFGDADAAADSDVHAEVHADVHAEVGADAHLHDAGDLHGAEGDMDHADAEGAHEAGHDHAGHDHADHDEALILRLLGWLGLGRVPSSIIFMLYALSWGAIGFLINYQLSSSMPWEWTVLFVSLPAAAVGSTAFTRVVVRALAKWMPTTESSARPRASLVASTGTALYAIDHTFGMASVRTREGDLFQFPCRTYEGRQPIAKGKSVLLVDYDAKQKLFYVIENDVEV